MARILFLAHRIPYPPNKGDKIRSWHILEYLSARHEVHLGTFVDDPEDWQHVSHLKDHCADVLCLGLDPRTARLKSLRELSTGKPLSIGFYRSPKMTAWVRDKLEHAGIDRIFLFSSPMAQFIPGTGRRMVMDFVDIDSDKWAQYAAGRKGPMRWVYKREARTLLAYERQVARTAEASLFVSDAEAAHFRDLAPESAEKVHALNNGVDHFYFSPDADYEDPYAAGAEPMVFTGAMDYWANVEAVTWFARDILPRIRAERPAAEFWIVGGKPAPAVKALGALPGVTVTGRVPDVRPYIAHARLVVAPLRIARGVQNKVLEGMAMARPVVATSLAAKGIDCRAGEEILLRDSVADFATGCLEALAFEDNHPLATRARARVLRSYDWTGNLTELDRLLSLPPAGEAAAPQYADTP